MAATAPLEALLSVLNPPAKLMEEAPAALLLAGAVADPDDEHLSTLWTRHNRLPASIVQRFFTASVAHRIADRHPEIVAGIELAAAPGRRQLVESFAERAEAEANERLAGYVAFAALRAPVMPNIVVRMAAVSPEVLSGPEILSRTEVVGEEIAQALVAWCLDARHGAEIGATEPLSDEGGFALCVASLNYLVKTERHGLAGRLCGQGAALEALSATPSLLTPQLIAESCDPQLPEKALAQAIAWGDWGAASSLIYYAGPEFRSRLLATVPWQECQVDETDAQHQQTELRAQALDLAARRLGTAAARLELFWALGKTWEDSIGGLVDATLQLEARVQLDALGSKSA